MIAVDTSALMAIILDEPNAQACRDLLVNETNVLISAATVAEALIVAARRDVAREMAQIIEGLGFDIVPVTPDVARRVADTYQKWGKGLHPAGLNFGDCFSYDVAKTYGCRLLFVGKDFSQTDLMRALPAHDPTR